MIEEMAKVEQVVDELNRRILETYVRPRVTAEIIREHREDPFGPHTPELEIVLRYVRRDPDHSKPRYVIVNTEPAKRACVAVLDRARGGPVEILSDDCFASEEEAEHAIFLMRLRDLGLWNDGAGAR